MNGTPTLTVGEMAREMGCDVYDAALPSEWAKAFEDATGFDPVGSFVWAYDPVWSGATSFGRPLPLTLDAVDAYVAFLSH